MGKVLGNCSTNRWCIFCKYWYNPSGCGLTPRVGRNLFDVDNLMKAKCMKTGLNTPAIHNCPKFERKF